jgi:hypothetical protein
MRMMLCMLMVTTLALEYGSMRTRKYIDYNKKRG